MLKLIFHKQRELQTSSYGVDPSTLDGEDRRRYIVDMTTALTDELHEALAETGWKPWATSRHFNRSAYLDELIDALHFLINLMLVAGTDADEITRRYLEKNARNAARQQAGYDGVTGKCANCGRALDDKNVTCTEDRCDA